MKRLLLALCLLLPLSLSAQGREMADDDGAGFLQGLLQDALSDVGRDVRIEGFRGALSSTATMDKLTISDSQGTWLTLGQVTLNWNRAALLSGRLEVTELSAARLVMPRQPAPTQSLPSPEASPLEIPELPVSVQIGKFSIAQVVLGKPLLGQAAQLSVSGSGTMQDGSAKVDLSVLRTDATAGSFILQAEYAKPTRHLSVLLSLEEPRGGLISARLGLPGTPSTRLNIAGEGPLSDFRAQVMLSTDGQTRLAGNVTLSGAAEDQTATRFAADLSGNIAPILPPQHRAFFGQRSSVSLSGHRAAGGLLFLDQLDLRTDAISLSGHAQIGADGWPRQFDLSAALALAGGTPVVLPFAGGQTQVQEGQFDLSYDAAQGDEWQLLASLTDLQNPDLSLETVWIEGAGAVTQKPSNAVTGTIAAHMGGVALTDQALAQALGSDMSAALDFTWTNGAPLWLRNLVLTGNGYKAAGDISINRKSGAADVDVSLDLNAAVGSLKRLSALSRQKLAGAADLQISGDLHPLAGAMDISIRGRTVNLSLGQPRLDPFLTGDGQLTAKIKRDQNGLTLPDLLIQTDHATLAGSAALSSQSGQASLDLDIPNLAKGLPELPGAASLSATAQRDQGKWDLSLSGRGPAGANITGNGWISADGSDTNIRLQGTAPMALANGFIRPISLSGMARLDLTMTGQPALSALSGQFTTRDARLALPDQRFSLEQIAAEVTLGGGSARLNLSTQAASGGAINLSGSVGLHGSYAADLTAELTDLVLADPTLYQTTISGPLHVSGPLAGGARISGQLQMGQTELRVPNPSGAEQADLPGLRHVNIPADVARTRRYAGLVETTGGGGGAGTAYGLDLTINAPDRIFVRGRGLDAELGGALTLKGDTNDVLPQGRFDLIRGRLDILGKRLSLTEGLIQLQGAFDPYISFSASTDAGDTTATILIEGQATAPELNFTSSPSLPQDEVLALILFDKDISSISAFQAVRLAAAIRTLTGKGGDGLGSKVRKGLALDDLDVTTSDTGAAEASAGKYLSENIYSEVTADTEGNTQINLNLTINRSVTARGSLASDGETGIGVFIEKDY